LNSHDALRALIDDAYESRTQLNPRNTPAALRSAIETAIDLLNEGQLRVAQPQGGAWQVNQWLKKAVLLSFRISDNESMPAGALNFYDKVPLKYSGWSADRFAAAGVRVVPPATVRRGAYIAANVVLMPSYVNVGAYVDSGTMVDTWATVGSCAQIGKNVHLSGGVGIGGVLEPPNAVPVVVEDECMIGSRSMIVEGARVRTGAVLGPATSLSRSTHVIDVETGEELPRGEAPAWSVCLNGTRWRKFPGGEYGMPCVLVLKRLPEGERHSKAELNAILREHGVEG
jgi:2,3,4,5-tetrahydropyridine-2,6-dicarboxylate N-succinyltransferase